MSNCPPHQAGAACDWPLCENGRADAATRRCICHNYYAPPYCIACLPGYWGEKCDQQPLSSISGLEGQIPPIVFQLGAVLFLVVVFLVLLMIGHKVRNRFQRQTPPTYAEVVKDPPPPYSL